MKILLTSRAFYPQLGGLCPIAYLAAKDWLRRGHEVRLLTQAAGQFEGEGEIPIFRRPTIGQMIEHYRWCDVIFQNDISLYFSIPQVVVRRPWVVSMSGWTNYRAGNSTGQPSLMVRMMGLSLSTVLRRATLRIAACAAVAAGNRIAARVIPNPFDAAQFKNTNPGMADRTSAFLFAGRLVTDKGVDDLIRAIALLQRRGVGAELVVAGDGPERKPLEMLAKSEGVAAAVTFAGPQSGEALMQMMNRHRVMVVPSRWYEPIAIVALEAMACGCVVVGSEGGGLAVTVGPCGLTYPNGDVEALADRLATILEKGANLAEYTDQIPRHLERYQPARIGGEYLEELEKAVRLSAPNRQRS